MSKSKGPSQRQLRVGELIRHALAELFSRGDVADPDVERLGVTVLEVSTSPDLKIATAWVRPFFGDDHETLVEALNRNRRYIRGAITPKLNLKFTPDLRFRHDPSQDQASRIDELLRDPSVQRDLSGPATDHAGDD